MEYGIIYKITNTINGNIYIGQTITSLESRWASHISSAKCNKPWVICSAIRKYGKGSFIIVKIDSANCKEDLNALEIKYIKELSPQYNMCTGGGGTGSPTVEVRQKMSLANKGKKKSEDFCRALSVRQTGRKLSDITKARIKNSLLGRYLRKTPVSKIEKDALILRNKNRRIHPEISDELKTAMLGMSKNEKMSYRAKLNSSVLSERMLGDKNPMYGKLRSDEEKQKLSEISSGANNPYYGKKHSEEALEKMRNAHRDRPLVVCPHCNKQGILSNMKRWHLDNCKEKK
jgi:group I intron endonuclease